MEDFISLPSGYSQSTWQSDLVRFLGVKGVFPGDERDPCHKKENRFNKTIIKPFHKSATDIKTVKFIKNKEHACVSFCTCVYMGMKTVYCQLQGADDGQMKATVFVNGCVFSHPF